MQFNNLSVTEFNNIIKNIFDAEEMLFNCCVVGEISSFKITNNVAYFVIKDELACLNCVWFSPDKNLKVGEKVKICGRPNYYVKGGKLNFNVLYVTSFGEGDIYKRFLLLKQSLASQGYFLGKKELPKSVRSIGVVTSSKGAVIKDIISVTKRRNKNVDIYVFPSKVQGENADKEICKGINFFANFDDVDVIIIARGGGSNEDLNAFNSESVAKACFVCEKPIISAVGHETDNTLIDLVADIRASTPSVAAEIAVKESKNYAELLNAYFQRFLGAIVNKKELVKQSLISSLKGDAAIKLKISKIKNLIKDFGHKLEISQNAKFENIKQKLTQFETKIQANNPKFVLKNGFALIEKNGVQIKNADMANVGDKIKIYVNDGEIEAKIEGVKKYDN